MRDQVREREDGRKDGDQRRGGDEPNAWRGHASEPNGKRPGTNEQHGARGDAAHATTELLLNDVGVPAGLAANGHLVFTT
jgi:hypothetical protein